MLYEICLYPHLKQSTLIHIQTHTYRQSYINSLKIHVRHIQNKGEDKGTALARSVVVIYYWGLKPFFVLRFLHLLFLNYLGQKTFF